MDNPLLNNRPKVTRDILLPYFFLTYLAVLVNAFSYLRQIKYPGAFTVFVAAAMYLVYSLVYIAPVFLLVWLVHFVFSRSWFNRILSRIRLSPTAATCIIAVIATGLLQVLLFADGFVFRLYGFHINGFVWNLVMTRGGIESLGNSPSTTRSFILIILLLFVVQVLLLFLTFALARRRRDSRPWIGRRVLISGVVAIVCMAAFEQVSFGVCCLHNYTPVIAASDAFPLFAPITFSHLAKRMGVKVRKESTFMVKMDASSVKYPLSPIQTRPLDHAPYNVIFLVAESVRYDMLDPEIMPATWKIAQQSLWCKKHYSGGNGTRMAMFSMFYGLYGSWWFPFLTEKRGPVLVDTLLDQNYQMELYTSAGFAYPEFDKTLFARVSPKHLHERVSLPQWRCDQEQVGAMLDFIDHRDPAHPFFTFMFFESPHANYQFPPENAIRKPFMDDLNYATMDLNKDIGLMKNRYINACNHFDSQVDRIFKHLRENKLLDSTIVLVTGDHGEEFMEKGRWGHNSSFHEEQTRSPFVLWVPGKQPRLREDITSHLDVPATILPLMGVTNPPSDYSYGHDLFGNDVREYTVVCSWNSVAYVDNEYKAIIPLKATGFAHQQVTTRDDVEIEDTSSFFAARKLQLVKVISEFKTFSK